MKIASLQYVPIQGNIAGSIAKVEDFINKLRPGDVDLLLLPELAFAGYNFPSLEAIKPFLENSKSGPSSHWAKNTAYRLRSIVGVGYAETTYECQTEGDNDGSAKEMDRKMNFNSNLTFEPGGKMVAHYRKHLLYTTDESWCVGGSECFYAGDYPAPVNKRVAQAICMDINPNKFTAPVDAMEFAHHARDSGADLVLVSLAWSNFDLTAKDVLESPSKMEPDKETIRFWISRMAPLVQAEKYVVLVMTNRSGVEEDVVYSGTSLIARIGWGNVEIWDVAAKGDERLLFVDTDTRPNFIWDIEAKELRVNDKVAG